MAENAQTKCYSALKRKGNSDTHYHTDELEDIMLNEISSSQKDR